MNRLLSSLNDLMSKYRGCNAGDSDDLYIKANLKSHKDRLK